MIGLAALAALGFTACNNADNAGTPSNTKDVIYSGILPAADAQGTIYTLKLEYDDDNNYTDGDYILVENSLMSDTVAASGLKEAALSYTEGDFKKLSKQVNGQNVEYIVLTPEAKDALGVPSTGAQYFIVNGDQSLILVNESLEMPTAPELYTMTKK